MWIAFIEPFGLVFWLLVLASTLLMTWYANEGDGLKMLFTMGGTIALFALFSKIQFDVEYFKENLTLWLISIGAYLGLAGAWGFAKWWLYLHKNLRIYTDKKIQWLREQKISGNVVPEDMKTKWLAFLESRSGYGYNYAEQIKPEAWNNKGKIVSWMAFWPWSVLSFLFADLCRNIFDHMYNCIRGILERMSDHVFSGVKNEFTKEEQ